ncbi:MAG: tRNA lysidine(34) synthetase TilS [Gemmatimonadota bacterium]
MNAEPGSLPERVAERLAALGVQPRETLLVACSGGVDSLSLLHLLRFGVGNAWSLAVAHYDHAMREASGADADWLRGVCRAWSVPFHGGRAHIALRNEDQARRHRYDFLERVRSQTRAERVLTAHHADDQAETVLFRILRGTGPAGLAGIPARRGAHILRPLLPFWRAEIEAYAERVGLNPRLDPSNLDPAQPRARLRHHILPELERAVAPGARRSLVRLAALARESEEAWEARTRRAEARARVGQGTGWAEWSVPRLRRLQPHLALRVLRHGARALGVHPDQESSRRLFEALASTQGRFHIRGGLDVERYGDRLRFALLKPPAGVDTTGPPEDLRESRAPAAERPGGASE